MDNKYVKVWTGPIRGSMAGRDDGYLETKYKYYNTFEQVVNDFGKYADEKIYELKEIDTKPLVEELQKKNKDKEKKQLEIELKKIEEETKMIKERLRSI